MGNELELTEFFEEFSENCKNVQKNSSIKIKQ